MRKLFDGGEINGEFFRDISRFVSLARLSCIVEDKSGANCVEIGQTACICTCANHRRISKEPLQKGSSILRCRHIIAVTFRTSSLPIPLPRDKKAHSERRTIVYYFFFSSTKIEYKNNRDSLSLSLFFSRIREIRKSQKKRGKKAWNFRVNSLRSLSPWRRARLFSTKLISHARHTGWRPRIGARLYS